MAAALFISDLHLTPGRADAAQCFSRFVKATARGAAALYILGDLFEYWAGDDDLDDDFNAVVVGELRELADSGTRVYFIAGNRDFLIGQRFADAAGLTLLADGSVHDIGGVPTLLMHGDLLCTDDVKYQEFRSTVRGEQWQRDFLAQPLAARKAQIEGLRRTSEAEKQKKSMLLMDANHDAVATALRHSGCPRLIHGHTHRLAHHRENVDGRLLDRWVLGDWYESGNYLACDEQGCRFLPLPFA